MGIPHPTVWLKYFQLRPKNYSTVNKIYGEGCLRETVFLLYRDISNKVKRAGDGSVGKVGVVQE